ncbi:zinc-binding dehydrogenase [Streptomyces catenulae]|uniref:zinc-binding dehydrogenase n=1 Tax=Streptomyces catenulae TaxID=66875 RepID=UPI0004BE5947
MLAVSAVRADARDPLGCLTVAERDEPVPAAGWTTVTVRAAALNRHDLWTLRGVGPAFQRLPIVLGSDAAGVDQEGNPVLVHSVVTEDTRGGEGSAPRWSVLGERYDGTFAERVAVPRENLVPKPAGMSFEDAACLPGAWLTAYRMLFDRAALEPGATVLVQGAGGGVATALIVLGSAAGYRVWVTGRSAERRKQAEALGAEAAFPPGARLPSRVDAVMETVGEATWEHSLRSVRDGGRVVVSGATTGALPPAELTHVFFRELTITGCTLGSRDQLARLARFCTQNRLAPVIDRVLPLSWAREGFRAMSDGTVFGKVVFTP